MKMMYGIGAVVAIAVGGYALTQSNLFEGTAHAEEALAVQQVEEMVNAAAEMAEPTLDDMVEEMTQSMEEEAVDATSVRAYNRTDLPEALRYRETDLTLGDPNAPVQMVEYASKTCGHCAKFHEKTLQSLKDGAIKEGKLFFIYRELPWDNLALLASKIARCAPKEQQMGYVEVFYSTQEVWAQAEKPVDELKKVARLGGMDEKTFEACAESEEIQNIIMTGRTEALDVLKIDGTPTVYIDAKRVDNVQNMLAINAMIDEFIAEQGQ